MLLIVLLKVILFWEQINKKMEVNISKNQAQNGLEIRFPGRPEQSVLDQLHKWGFRWSRFNKVWYHRFSDALMEEVKDYFKDADVLAATEQIARADTSGISIEPGMKIHKNSSYLKYLMDHVVSGTEYYMVYDDPYPTRDNDPVEVDYIKSEIRKYGEAGGHSGTRLWHSKGGHFTLSWHSNHHLDFVVEGVTDKIIAPDTSLKASNFYVNMKWETVHGDFDVQGDKKKSYNIGDRVVTQSFGFKRTGTVVADKSYKLRFRTLVGGSESESEMNYTYEIQNDSGVIDSMQWSENIRPMEPNEEANSIPDIFSLPSYSGRPEYRFPSLVFDAIKENVRHYKYDLEKADRAKKAENIASWKRSAEVTKQKFIQLMTDWYWWEGYFLDFAREITGETIEEQKTRRGYWSKQVLPMNETTVFKVKGHDPDVMPQFKEVKQQEKAEPPTGEKSQKFSDVLQKKIDQQKKRSEQSQQAMQDVIEKKTPQAGKDDFVKQHIIIGGAPKEKQKVQRLLDEFVERGVVAKSKTVRLLPEISEHELSYYPTHAHAKIMEYWRRVVDNMTQAQYENELKSQAHYRGIISDIGKVLTMEEAIEFSTMIIPEPKRGGKYNKEEWRNIQSLFGDQTSIFVNNATKRNDDWGDRVLNILKPDLFKKIFGYDSLQWSREEKRDKVNFSKMGDYTSPVKRLTSFVSNMFDYGGDETIGTNKQSKYSVRYAYRYYSIYDTDFFYYPVENRTYQNIISGIKQAWEVYKPKSKKVWDFMDDMQFFDKSLSFVEWLKKYKASSWTDDLKCNIARYIYDVPCDRSQDFDKIAATYMMATETHHPEVIEKIDEQKRNEEMQNEEQKKKAKAKAEAEALIMILELEAEAEGWDKKPISDQAKEIIRPEIEKMQEFIKETDKKLEPQEEPRLITLRSGVPGLSFGKTFEFAQDSISGEDMNDNYKSKTIKNLMGKSGKIWPNIVEGLAHPPSYSVSVDGMDVRINIHPQQLMVRKFKPEDENFSDGGKLQNKIAVFKDMYTDETDAERKKKLKNKIAVYEDMLRDMQADAPEVSSEKKQVWQMTRDEFADVVKKMDKPKVITIKADDRSGIKEIKFVKKGGRQEYPQYKAIAIYRNGKESPASASDISEATGEPFFMNETKNIGVTRLVGYLNGYLTLHEAEVGGNLSDFSRGDNSFYVSHYRIVSDAYKQGKPVPQKVAKEYGWMEKGESIPYASGGDVKKFTHGGNIDCEDGCHVKGNRHSHPDGGEEFIVKETGRHVELEAGEVVIPPEVVESGKTYDFHKATVKHILNKINTDHGENKIDYGKPDTQSKTMEPVKLRNGSAIIKVSAVESKKLYDFTGATAQEILNKINTDHGGKPIG